MLGAAAAADHGAVAALLIGLVVILTAARLAGELARRAGQPAVLGELVVGILLGNLHRLGIGWFQGMAADPILAAVAQIGVIILLFEVGLESTVRDMMRVGITATVVAVLGIVTPFALGWGVGALLLPGQSVYVHAFLGATLTATSVGITARVLRELGKSQTPEARVILGAAVVDDILGLVILAVVAGAISAANMGQSLSLGPVAMVLLKAGLFLGGAVILGTWLGPRLFRSAARLRGPGVLLTTAIVFCFGLAYLASVVGMAPIIGAYAAGLVLESLHWRDFTARGEHELEELIQPVATLLVPVFFVLMGMRVDLSAFARTEVLGLAGLLTLAAIMGKQACSLGAGRGLNRLAVGIGMVPRGEVGLIFAGIGLTLTIGGKPVIDQGVFSAVVIMVIVTTMITPPALKWSLSRRPGPSASTIVSPS